MEEESIDWCLCVCFLIIVILFLAKGTTTAGIMTEIVPVKYISYDKVVKLASLTL